MPGRGAGFSVEAPEGMRFLTRSRLFTDDEWAALEAAGPPARGPDATADAAAGDDRLLVRPRPAA